MTNCSKIRLIDVAREAHASLGAVGKVLNGGGGTIRVGAETRRRILEVAARLGYRQNVVASILAGGRSNLVGVVIDTRAGYRNKRLLTAIESAAAKRGLRLMTGVAHDDVDSFGQLCRKFMQYGVDGLLVISHDYPEFRSGIREFEKSIPEAVFLEKPYFPTEKYVATSRRKAMAEMVSDAVLRGKRRIAVIHGALESISEQALMAEYQEALAAHGIEFDPALVHSFRHPSCKVLENAAEIISGLVEKRRPDVLFTDDAEYAVAIQSRLQAMGWKLPADLEIIGGNDDSFFRLVEPAVASFDPDYDGIAEALLDKLPEKASEAVPSVVEAAYRRNRTGDTGSNKKHRMEGETGI